MSPDSARSRSAGCVSRQAACRVATERSSRCRSGGCSTTSASRRRHPGRHLSLVQTFAGWLADGDFGKFFDPGAQFSEDFFTPLVHFIGSIPSALGLATQDWAVIAANLVFVPCLRAASWSVG